jgi:hypothetical protein
VVKTGEKVVRRGLFVAFQLAEDALPRDPFSDILHRNNRRGSKPVPT